MSRRVSFIARVACALLFACGADDDDGQAASGANAAGSLAPAALPGGGGGMIGSAAGTGGSAVAGGMGGAVGPFDAGTAVPPAAIDAGRDSGRPAMPAMDAQVTTPDAGSGGDMTPDDDRCDVAVLDPASPPRALEVSGNLGTHDPTVIEEDGVFYELQTGPRLPAKRSSDLRAWQDNGRALGSSNPAWVAREVPQANDLWAPDLSFFGGQYHVYYSASSFGSNSSCIGHATRATMSSGNWTDHGAVVCSNHGSNDNWNAIDPNVIVDQSGKAYLSFGSFWDGIKAIELDESGARSGTALHSLASRGGGAIEAPYIVRRCGFYYLFVSFDRCCQGMNSTYNIRVGRSENVLGPYVDKSDRRMLDGGGTQIVQGGGSWRGPGHNAVLFSGDKAYNIFHAYRSDNGASQLRIAELAWDADGWPVSGGP
jgi:arabinan endo-1,5-alpha-L-arabinosidase